MRYDEEGIPIFKVISKTKKGEFKHYTLTCVKPFDLTNGDIVEITKIIAFDQKKINDTGNPITTVAGVVDIQLSHMGDKKTNRRYYLQRQ